MNGVDKQSQAGESLSTGVGLSIVYAAFKAKVEKSISIMDVSDGGLTINADAIQNSSSRQYFNYHRRTRRVPMLSVWRGVSRKFLPR